MKIQKTRETNTAPVGGNRQTAREQDDSPSPVFRPVLFTEPSAIVAGDVVVPSPVAELPLENQSVGRIFELQVPWLSL